MYSPSTLCPAASYFPRTFPPPTSACDASVDAFKMDTCARDSCTGTEIGNNPNARPLAKSETIYQHEAISIFQ